MTITTKDIEYITGIVLKTIRQVHTRLHQLSRTVGSNPVDIHRSGGRTKRAITYDILAETLTNAYLHAGLKSYKPIIVGEEFGDEDLTEDLDFTGRDNVVVLLDMIDGTDLFERRLSNWCSAVVVYHPSEEEPERRIIASFVALPGEAIYFARRDEAVVHKVTFNGSVSPPWEEVTGPSQVENIATASIGFYGQKIKSLLSVTVADQSNVDDLKPHAFVKNLARFEKTNRQSETRIYNLGGNPMMIRMIDGVKRIDGLFNLSGCLAHDAVPGLYIAQKAGATVRSLDASELTGAQLADKLMKPADKGNAVSYILASTGQLSDALLRLMT